MSHIDFWRDAYSSLELALDVEDGVGGVFDSIIVFGVCDSRERIATAHGLIVIVIVIVIVITIVIVIVIVIRVSIMIVIVVLI